MWTLFLSGHKIRPCSPMNWFYWYWFSFQVTFSWPSIWVFPPLFICIENEPHFSSPEKVIPWVQKQKGHLSFKFHKVTVESVKSQRGNWMNKSVQSIRGKFSIEQLHGSYNHEQWNHLSEQDHGKHHLIYQVLRQLSMIFKLCHKCII